MKITNQPAGRFEYSDITRSIVTVLYIDSEDIWVEPRFSHGHEL